MATGAAVVRWAVENPALAQLLHWRPVPGFEPSPEVFAAGVQSTEDARAEFAEGVFSRLTDSALEQFLSAYRP